MQLNPIHTFQLQNYAATSSIQPSQQREQFTPASIQKGSRDRKSDSTEFSDQSLQALARDKNKGAKGTQQLSEEEKKEVEQLKKRDKEVRAHEMAHLAAAGGHARGGASFSFEVGPDGKRYATGGEVPIDVSEVPDDPEATIQKMNVVRSAALAPANPSGADKAIAAKAAATAANARVEMMEKTETSVQSENEEVTDFEPLGQKSSKYHVEAGLSAYAEQTNEPDFSIISNSIRH